MDYRLPLRHDRDREILAEIFSRHCYRPPFALSAPRVLDLGANIGLFSAFAIRNLGAKEIVAVEADPDNLRTLSGFVADHDLPVQIIEGFAGTKDGSVEFEAGLAANSRVAGPDSEKTISVNEFDVFALGSFDLAKIDIEGSEWKLLADPRFPQLAPVVVMEWHRRGQGAVEIGEALGAHGYDVHHTDPHLVWGRRRESGPQTARHHPVR